jgi:type II secretory pathway pseudopilin PulG
MLHDAGKPRIAIHQPVAALAAALILAAVLTPQVVRSVRDARARETEAQLRALGTSFARHRDAHGQWPCRWGARAGQLELGSPACRAPAASSPRDAWGRPILAVYQPPTGRIPGARDGVIALLSAGADGEVRTSRRRAVEGQAVGDDLIHIVTRSAG